MTTSLPHRRYNPLTKEWIVVSPQRANRPWQTTPAKTPKEKEPEQDPGCYLCPGNHRSPPSGKKIQNPDYKGIFVFGNDFPALLDKKTETQTAPPLFHSQGISGVCRVICYSHLHNTHLGDMKEEEIAQVVEEWIRQIYDLGNKYKYVQVFENKGEMVGCSSPHPHGQIWALDYVPHLVGKENTSQKEYYSEHDSSLLFDYLEQENRKNERIVFANDSWTLLVPYWAYWPYETILLPNRPLSSMLELNEEEKSSLAETLKILAKKYDSLFHRSFPYMMGWHGVSRKEDYSRELQLHCHFYPPLLDSIKQKYMAGFEVFAELQRDITPEQAAARLKEIG